MSLVATKVIGKHKLKHFDNSDHKECIQQELAEIETIKIITRQIFMNQVGELAQNQTNQHCGEFGRHLRTGEHLHGKEARQTETNSTTRKAHHCVERGCVNVNPFRL